MELAEGGERTIDGIADGRRVVLGHPKTREAMRAGLAMYFVTLADDAADGARRADRRGARDRALLQHPARRRARHRGQPAHLDDRLPGGSEHPLPRRQARARRDLRRGARRRTRRAFAPAERRSATSTSSSGTRDKTACPRDSPSDRGAAATAQGLSLRRGASGHALPGELRRHPVAERARAPAEGRRRAARRLQPRAAPSRSGLVARPPRRLRATAAHAVARARATASAHRRLPLLLRADARAQVAAVPDPARDAQEVRLPLPRLGHSRQDAGASSPTASAPTRRSSARSTRCAGCPRRR